MPSMEESKRKVKDGLESLKNDIDHDAILQSLQEEIDRHNNESNRDSINGEHASTGKFRFKSTTSGTRKRRRSPGHHRRHHRKHRSHHQGQDSAMGEAHPFPREPARPDDQRQRDPQAAFRESLFDALADDEGAAYWEDVYGQPIHVYSRPTVTTQQGELEGMNDDEYVAYVQTKMWEKKHPHIVKERNRREKEQKREEEERVRQREEYVRRKQRAAWERAEREAASRAAGVDDDDGNTHRFEYVFDFDPINNTTAEHASRRQRKLDERNQTWHSYLASWDKLRNDLSVEPGSSSQSVHIGRIAEKLIPWPVLSREKPVSKDDIEDFMREVTSGQDGPTRLRILKAERVRWHPDKLQQLFRGHISEGTGKLITSVFQVIDALYEKERGREQKVT